MATTLYKRRMYRSRVKSSICRGKPRSTCSRTKKCKRANGKKRTYCRKKSNRNIVAK